MNFLKTTLLGLLISNSCIAGNSFQVSLADTTWDGKTVPENQQCKRFGGHGKTPALLVEHIPTNSNAIVMEYSDKSYQAMDNGGHGKLGFHLSADTRTVNIPAVAGHTFELPENFYLMQAQQAPDWDQAGAYLPPCSGGKGNAYYVTVKAVRLDNGKIQKLLAETEIPLGLY